MMAFSSVAQIANSAVECEFLDFIYREEHDHAGRAHSVEGAAHTWTVSERDTLIDFAIRKRTENIGKSAFLLNRAG